MTSDERREKINNLFVMAELPFKRLDCYGSQVVVVCWSRDAAEKIADILRRGTFTIRGIVKSIDHNKVNKKLLAVPSSHEVWKVFARA